MVRAMTKLFKPAPVDPPEELSETRLLAAQLVQRLGQVGMTVATAESLTGGLLSSAIVDVPGASTVFRGGVVSYATDVKKKVLGVASDLLKSGGPVQGEVAEQMAEGVANLIGADLAIATTGVAGPGDSPDGPQGLVFIGAVLDLRLGGQPSIRAPRVGTLQKWTFNGTRDEVRRQAVDAALALGLWLLNQPHEPENPEW